jgi:hypothetical protein
MSEPHVEDLVIHRNRQLRWEAFLPKRKAWLQTLILLPFGLPVAHFLATSWQFSINSIFEERQYLIGFLSMWRSTAARWYPQAQALWAGCYATLTIAIAFGAVGLFTSSLGVCGNSAWNEIGQSLLCNLDGYGFESKSWFGVWFIIAAYCYRVRDVLAARANSLQQKMFRQRYAQPTNRPDLTSIVTRDGDLDPHEDLRATTGEPMTAKLQD